jgi:hypothetical protein
LGLGELLCRTRPRLLVGQHSHGSLLCRLCLLQCLCLLLYLRLLRRICLVLRLRRLGRLHHHRLR